MIVIKSINPLIEKILSNKIFSYDNLRLNKFCLEYDIDNSYLIYNGLTGEIILTDKSSNDEEYMHEHYYYVPIDYDEYKLIDEIRNVLNLLKNKSISNYTILTTSDCNARCFYCYQKGITKSYMDKQTSYKVSDYLLKHIDHKQKVNITWFGGEPLLNIEAIDIISSVLKDNNINYCSSIITNGSLINDEIINRCKNTWNTSEIQITLDGTKDIYNKTKNYIDSSSFDVVVRNIELLISNKIYVSIRLNLTKYNDSNLKELIDYLHNKFSNNQHYGIYVSLLYQDEKNIKIVEELYKKKIELEKYLYNLEILENKIDLDLKTNCCIADNINSTVISPDGNLYSCEHINEDNTYGTIINDDTKSSSVLDYYKQKEECNKCFYYPLCINLKTCPSNPHYCLDYMKDEYLLKMQWKIKDLYKRKVLK